MKVYTGLPAWDPLLAVFARVMERKMSLIRRKFSLTEEFQLFEEKIRTTDAGISLSAPKTCPTGIWVQRGAQNDFF